MSKNDKYTVEIKEPGTWTVCIEGKAVEMRLHVPMIGYRDVYSRMETPLAFADVTVAEDFCYLLNQAFAMRVAKEQAEKEFDRREKCGHEWATYTAGNPWRECMKCGTEENLGQTEDRRLLDQPVQATGISVWKPAENVVLATCQHDWGKNQVCAKCGADRRDRLKGGGS